MVDSTYPVQRTNRSAHTRAGAETAVAEQSKRSGSNRFAGRLVKKASDMAAGHPPVAGNKDHSTLKLPASGVPLQERRARTLTAPPIGNPVSFRPPDGDGLLYRPETMETLLSAGVPERYANFIVSTIEKHHSAAGLKTR